MTLRHAALYNSSMQGPSMQGASIEVMPAVTHSPAAGRMMNEAAFQVFYHLNYAQIRRSHRRWSCGDSGTRVNSVISQVVFSAVSLPV